MTAVNRCKDGDLTKPNMLTKHLRRNLLGLNYLYIECLDVKVFTFQVPQAFNSVKASFLMIYLNSMLRLLDCILISETNLLKVSSPSV